MEILESHPLLGQLWCVSLASAQQNRIGNRPESKSERFLAAFGEDCSREAAAQAQLPYAIPLRLWGSIGRLRRPFLDKNAEAKLRLWRSQERGGWGKSLLALWQRLCGGTATPTLPRKRPQAGEVENIIAPSFFATRKIGQGLLIGRGIEAEHRASVANSLVNKILERGHLPMRADNWA